MTETVPGRRGVIDTVEVLERLKDVPPTRRSDADNEDLEALIRKVQVARRVMVEYGAGWRRRRGSRPLSVNSWPLLVEVLLHHSSGISSQDASEDELGRALKSLNGAFAALNHSQAKGLELEELTRRAEEQLVQIEGCLP